MTKIIDFKAGRDQRNEERRKTTRVRLLGDLVKVAIQVGGYWDFFYVENISENGFAMRVEEGYQVPDEMRRFTGKLYLGSEYFIPFTAELAGSGREGGSADDKGMSLSFRMKPDERVQGVLRSMMELVDRFATHSNSAGTGTRKHG